MKKLIYILLAAPLFFVACDQDEIPTFDNEDAGVYFQYGGQTRLYINIDQYYDSVAYSFSTAADTVTQHVIETRIRTLGKVRDYDRPVKVVVDHEGTTMTEGVHYRANLDNVVIPAGASEVQVPVTFFRTPDLEDQRLTLMLKVEPNEHFMVPFTSQKSTNVYYSQGEIIRADRFLFSVSEIYTMPFYWAYFGNEYFGNWSVSKFKYINRICEIPASDWERGGNSDSKVQLGRFVYYAYKVRNALQEAADAGNPVLDDDGSFMQLGSAYQVDYSGNY